MKNYDLLGLFYTSARQQFVHLFLHPKLHLCDFLIIASSLHLRFLVEVISTQVCIEELHITSEGTHSSIIVTPPLCSAQLVVVKSFLLMTEDSLHPVTNKSWPLRKKFYFGFFVLTVQNYY